MCFNKFQTTSKNLHVLKTQISQKYKSFYYTKIIINSLAKAQQTIEKHLIVSVYFMQSRMCENW